MGARLERTPTKVPIAGGRAVEIEPGMPWPSTYRGSQYSLVTSRRSGPAGLAARWKYKGLRIEFDAPEGLAEAMRTVGKTQGVGTGSFRVTTGREVLAKVQAKNYPHLDKAPASRGWIPVYLGKLRGVARIPGVDFSPKIRTESGIAVWDALPMVHGESWSVTSQGELMWRWRDYRFTSAFDHSDLIHRYDAYRQTPGRLYINEYGRIWINLPIREVAPGKEGEVRSLVRAWQENAQEKGLTQNLRLVQRRLSSTSPNGDPAFGCFPIYVGHLTEFDDGQIPKPIVTDPTYFVAASRGLDPDG